MNSYCGYCNNKKCDILVFPKLCIDCYYKIVWVGWRYKLKEIFCLRQNFINHVSKLKEKYKI